MKAREHEEPSYPRLSDLTARLVRLVEATPWEKRPPAMPADAHDAARWLLSMLEPPKAGEHPRKAGCKWEWRYAERIECLARHLFTLTPDFQRYVLAAAEDKVWWRGDDAVFFHDVVTETFKFQEDPEAYRGKAGQQFRALKQLYGGKR